jgi:hypothetical protein
VVPARAKGASISAFSAPDSFDIILIVSFSSQRHPFQLSRVFIKKNVRRALKHSGGPIFPLGARSGCRANSHMICNGDHPTSSRFPAPERKTAGRELSKAYISSISLPHGENHVGGSGLLIPVHISPSTSCLQVPWYFLI